MNILLLAKAHSDRFHFNRLHIKLAGNIEAGLLLDHLINHYGFGNSNTRDSVKIDDNSIYEHTLLFNDELSRARKKLNKLPFMSISKTKITGSFVYTLDPQVFSSYVKERLNYE